MNIVGQQRQSSHACPKGCIVIGSFQVRWNHHVSLADTTFVPLSLSLFVLIKLEKSGMSRT